MRKGLFFSIEAMYLLVAIFVIVVALFYSLPLVKQPDYDFISTLKVAHDMGQADTSDPPNMGGPASQNYDLGGECYKRDAVVIMDYYDYAGELDKRVCIR